MFRKIPLALRPYIDLNIIYIPFALEGSLFLPCLKTLSFVVSHATLNNHMVGAIFFGLTSAVVLAMVNS